MINRFTVYFILLFVFTSCGSDETKPKIEGCMDEVSLNFNPEATHDDGSCIFPADMLIGFWSVSEKGTFFNSTTFQTTNIATVTYNASITASGKTEISIETDRATSPQYDYDGPLEVLWEEGKLNVTGTNISGTIQDEDNFKVSYTYGLPGSGLYTINRTYVRAD